MPRTYSESECLHLLVRALEHAPKDRIDSTITLPKGLADAVETLKTEWGKVDVKTREQLTLAVRRVHAAEVLASIATRRGETPKAAPSLSTAFAAASKG
jgi:hypothetical protein